jgi:hypothetical protein
VAMQNHNGGRNVAVPDENQPSWRPEDDPAPRDFHRRDDDDRDERAWQDRRFTDDGSGRRYGDRYGYGHGPGGYTYRGSASGRYGDERLHELQQHRREDPTSAGSFEDRRRFGADERPAGRGSWLDRGGDLRPGHSSYRGRDFEPERRGLSRGYEERMGYPTGSGRGDERMGYAAGSYRHAGTQDALPRDPGGEGHIHRGTGPHRGKGPAGYQRSDERIRELVCESLTDDDQIDASRIDVKVENGEVTLTGSVDDRHAKRDAEDCACSIAGVRDVQNLLRVQPDDGRSNRSGATTVGKFETETPSPDRKARA